MKKSKTHPAGRSLARLRRLARKRADDQARRIPWQRLLEARNEYIAWQEFYLWVRSIQEVEPAMPECLPEILNTRCPGFLDNKGAFTAKAAKAKPLTLRLEDWIDEQVFGFAKKDAWFNAITYYAVRDPRYQRAEVCWSECVRNWKKAKPDRYPTIDEWKKMARECDPTAHLVPRERAAQACLKLVDPDRLTEAVSRYIDWEALAYWARLPLNRGCPLPAGVTEELNRHCPGLLKADLPAQQDSEDGSAAWQRLMTWIGDHFFQQAKDDGWFDAILIQKRIHPRSIRIREFSDHRRRVWGHVLPFPYPSFDQWRRDADAYVERKSIDRERLG